MRPGKSRVKSTMARQPERTVQTPSGDLLVRIALSFLGLPYEGATLDGGSREKLVVRLDAFDCTTFVETVLASALDITTGGTEGSGLAAQLKRIRYRGGKISGYASRLHYFRDWLADNEKKKILKDVSRLLGGRPQRKKINFMSSRPDLYPRLKSKAARDKIRQTEQMLSGKTFYTIDKKDFSAASDKIENGDIIAFVSGKQGLDVAHTGFAVRKGKRLRLLHASQKEGAVVISQKTLGAYLKSSADFTGIHVARIWRPSATICE